MATAKSESVRARMVEFLREIGFGKAIQTQDREIPKPPMEDEELLDTLNRLLANGPSVPGSNSSTLNLFAVKTGAQFTALPPTVFTRPI
jgi:hypothetical protein